MQLVLKALELAVEKNYLDRSEVNEDVLRMFLTKNRRSFNRQATSKEWD